MQQMVYNYIVIICAVLPSGGHALNQQPFCAYVHLFENVLTLGFLFIVLLLLEQKECSSL